jgi:ornithine cyclodeaminase
MKHDCQLPAKMSVHPTGNDFFTTMPCLLPASYSRFGAKVVSRIVGRVPALKSDLMLFNSTTGELLALIDCDWITAMRTGAVAALAIKTLRNSHATEYAFIGLGSTARATLTCLLESCKDEHLNIRLFKYKDQAEKIVSEYSNYSNATFTIVDNTTDLVKDADVVVSCITDANGLLVEDESLFKPGVLVVPIHTRGFQNCDTTFDKVFADDTDHVKGFKYFSQFKEFHQIEEVLKGENIGRASDDERILSYNIGLGLHDVLYASRIYDILK